VQIHQLIRHAELIRDAEGCGDCGARSEVDARKLYSGLWKMHPLGFPVGLPFRSGFQSSYYQPIQTVLQHFIRTTHDVPHSKTLVLFELLLESFVIVRDVDRSR
jgi:hypothetical protein